MVRLRRVESLWCVEPFGAAGRTSMVGGWCGGRLQRGVRSSLDLLGRRRAGLLDDDPLAGRRVDGLDRPIDGGRHVVVGGPIAVSEQDTEQADARSR